MVRTEDIERSLFLGLLKSFLMVEAWLDVFLYFIFYIFFPSVAYDTNVTHKSDTPERSLVNYALGTRKNNPKCRHMGDP